MSKVLIVDDKQMMRDSVAATLQRAGFQPLAADDGQSALTMISRHRPAAVVTDLKMPEMDGLELLSRIRSVDDQLPVVLMTAYGTVDVAVKAMKNGAFDFIQKPFEGDQLVITVRRAVEHRRLIQENAALKSTQQTLQATPILVGRSPLMRQMVQHLQQIAQSSGTVLICGESGTGKEVIARTIHAHSPRRERVMLAVNCAALSSNLLESELFGHEKGAFTGADQLRKGRFELADAGTLLLDEISEIGPELQAKLLRVLQEQQFERVGSSYSMNIDVRVIATTNRDLTRSVAMGTFRQDLFYRLNVLPISVPPLRQRLEDVPMLAEHFIKQLAMREGKEPKRFDRGALDLMQQYPWPGNVRELQNICERANVLSRDQAIGADLLRPWLTVPSSMVGRMAAVPVGHVSPSLHVGAMFGPGTNGHGTGGGAGGHLGGGGWPEVTVNSLNPHHASQAFSPDSSHESFLGETSGMREAMGGNSAEDRGGRGDRGGMGDRGDRGGRGGTLEEMERQQIIQTLGRFDGNRQKTATALGIGVRTLGLKLKKWKQQKLVAETL